MGGFLEHDRKLVFLPVPRDSQTSWATSPHRRAGRRATFAPRSPRVCRGAGGQPPHSAALKTRPGFARYDQAMRWAILLLVVVVAPFAVLVAACNSDTSGSSHSQGGCDSGVGCTEDFSVTGIC